MGVMERAAPRGDRLSAAADTEQVAELRAMVQALADLLIESGILDADALAARLGTARAQPAPSKPSLSAVTAIEAMTVPSLKPRGFFRSLFGRRPSKGPAARLAAEGEAEFTERLPRMPVDNLYDESQRSTELSFPPMAPASRASTGAAVCERCWRKLPAGQSGICQVCRS